MNFHDPASSTADQLFDRTGSTGGTVQRTALNASHLPLKDAAYNAADSAKTPYEILADTRAAKHIEAALRKLRTEGYEVYNFEARGGTPGFGIGDTDAVNNTKVWNRIIDEIDTAGSPNPERWNAILFPGDGYEFKEDGGTEILRSATVGANITVIGNRSALRAHAGANAAFPLFYFQDSSRIVLEGVEINRNGTTAGSSAVKVASTTSPVNYFRISNCVVSGGERGIHVVSPATKAVTNIWVNDLYVLSYALRGLEMESIQDATVSDVTFSGVAVGLNDIYVTAPTSTHYLSGLKITHNKLSGRLFVAGSSASHSRVTVDSNTINSGDMTLTNIDLLTTFDNWLLAGGVAITFNTAETYRGLKLLKSFVNGGISGGPGIWIIASNSAIVESPEIDGGEIHTPPRDGITLEATGAARIKWGRFHDILVKGAGQTTTNTYDSVQVKSGVQDSIFHDIICRSTDAAKKQRYGINELAAANNVDNLYHDNWVKGWGTAYLNLLGTLPIDQHNVDKGTGV